MNPITETSAVQSYMSSPYIQQAMANQNPETYEFEPMLAESWIAEDSIKLAPDYEGFERFVSLEGEEPARTLRVDFPETKNEKNPAQLTLQTYGPDQTPLGSVWVGFFPAEDIIGANKNGAHQWSDDNGKVVVAGLPAGKYDVKVGHEIFGVTEETDEGLRVRPETPKNPLEDYLKEQDVEYLTLADKDFVDIQRSTIYTYFIDPRAKWSDGTPYTSKDLEFAHAVVNNPIVDGDSLRTYYSNVIRCDGLDEHTVRMQYREQYFMAFEFTAGLAAYGPPFHYFKKLFQEEGKELTLERLSEAEEQGQNKVSAHGAAFGKFFNTDSRYNDKPMGTGPYVLDSWKKGDRIILKRNPNYWSDEYKGYLDEITFKFITDEVTALQALEGGEIDFLYRTTAEKFHEALSGPPDWFQGKYVKASWYIPVYSYIGWNLNRDLFQDRKVRVALALLLDLKNFVQQKQYGDAVLVSGSSYYFSPAYDHNVKPIGYDEETAKDLLSEAGWADTDGDGILDRDGVPFEFTYQLPTGSETGEALASIFQENAKQAGIKINVKRLEWASFLENVMNKDFDTVALGWASAPESDPYQLWHGSQAGADKRSSNHVSFNNNTADEIIEKIRVTLDKEERTKLFHQFHHLLDREQPYMFLYTPKEFGVYHNRYRGVKWYRLRPGFDLTEWYVPKDLQRK
jgi:peptide/nickel transport system substrate-binding protein